MIVFELNGQLSYMIPVLLSVLLSYAISNSLAMSIFDVLLDMKDLPYLPALRSVEHYKMTASHIMNKNFLYLTINSQLSDIIVLLQHLGPRAKSIPVVESEEDKVLLYSVQAQSLRKYLFSYYNTVSHTLDKELRDRLNNYFYNLYSISNNKMGKGDKKQKEHQEEALAFLQPDSDMSNIEENKDDSEAKHHSRKGSSFIHHKESMLKIREFNLKSMDPPSESSNSESSIEDDFWMIHINFNHEFLEIDKAPFSVMEETSMSKIHFLFTMLNLSQLFVIRRGVLVGIVNIY